MNQVENRLSITINNTDPINAKIYVYIINNFFGYLSKNYPRNTENTEVIVIDMNYKCEAFVLDSDF